MAWDTKYVNYGRIEYSDCWVNVYCGQYENVSLPNIPSGISRAYWQGTSVIVDMNDGWVYVFADGPYKNYTSKYKK